MYIIYAVKEALVAGVFGPVQRFEQLVPSRVAGLPNKLDAWPSQRNTYMCT